MMPPEDTQLTGSDSPDAIVPDADAIAALANLNSIDYDRVRTERAKTLGVQLKTLDQLVKEARTKISHGNRSPFPDTYAWPSPVDPEQLLDEISETLRKIVVMDPEQADAAALWAAHTHCVDAFDVSPIAAFNAPEKACAKTLLQTLIARISRRPLPAANASASALFRAVEAWQPTIFFDEADTFFREKPELQGMVNAGYKRGGYVLRSEAVGDTFEPRMFSVFSAKSIAGISLERHLPDSTMSRAIVFNLRRKLPTETVTRLRNADTKVFDDIASKLVRFSHDYLPKIRASRPDLPAELSDRAQDNWEPLLAIAECAGPVWVTRATNAALALSRSGHESVSVGNELLADIHDIFNSKCIERITTVELIRALTEDEEKPWATYNRGKRLSPTQLAKQLRFYGIKSKTVRFGRSTPKGYELSQFTDAFARYLTAHDEEPPPCNETPGASTGMTDGVSATLQPPRNASATRDAMAALESFVVSDDSPRSECISPLALRPPEERF